jgi:exosortase
MERTLVNRRVERRRVVPLRSVEQIRSYPLGLTVTVLASVAFAAWSYWPIIAGLSHTLRTSDDYSAGQLVPLVAVLFVWRDRKALKELQFVPCWSGGLLLLLLAEAARFYGYLSMRPSIEQYAVVVALASLILLVAGWQVLHRLSWTLLFLFLMVPLPNMIHSRISPPLQRLATTGSVFLLEVCGTPVTQQGNVVLLGNDITMAVAEACSGLRMLTAFVIVAAFIAYMVRRPRWQKAVLLASSIPVAVACNIIRIFLTAMVMLYASVELGEKFFHDYAGYVMMLAAVSLIFGEVWLMDRIVVPDEPEPAHRQKRATVAAARPTRRASPKTS